MKRVILVVIGVAWLLGITAAAALAEWPTTCVELNDLLEAGRGNDQNVGIYQRVHGDNAEAACRADHGSDGFVFGGRRFMTPSRDNPAAYTQAFVERAIDRYNNDGLQATLDYYNSPESIDGSWYIFIQDETTAIVAHAARPERLGLTSDDQVDVRGFHYGAEFATVPEGEGRWVSYWFVNPTTAEPEQKHSWIVRHDGRLFGSGWYESASSRDNPAAYTQAFVERAIDRYNNDGLQATLDYYNSPESIDGQWYVFIANTDVLLANAAVPSIVGTPSLDTRGADGYPIGRHLAAVATEQGAWADYYWVNPETGETQTKHSWIVVHDDVFFGSGWYEPGPSKDQPDTYTQTFVQRGITLYDDVGLDAVLDYYNSKESLDGAWYLFVFDENDVLRTHAATPALVDLPAREVTGPDLFPTGLQVVADATPEGAWTSYSWVNPATGETQTKHSWVVRRDGLVFGSGWYEPGPSKDDPAGYAQALVQRAVNLHASLGTDETLAYYNTPESADGPWYVFVLEDRAGVLYSIANANRPDIVGKTRERIDAEGFNYGEAFAAVTEASGGAWVSYLFTHPETRQDARKHSWVVRVGDLIFGVGWYEGI